MAALPLLFALVGAQAARAQGGDAASVEQAKMYFNAGAQAYTAGRYNVAVQAFDQAYKLAPRPAILFSMAQALKKQYFAAHQADDLKRAVALYQQYLKEVPTGGRRADATDALAELEPLAARLEPGTTSAVPVATKDETRLLVSSQTPKATASLDGKPPAELPLMEDVAPGKHHLHVTAEGYFDEDRDLDVKGSVGLDIPMREKPALLAVDAPAGADIAVDGRLLATTPLVRPLELTSGAHLVAVMKNGSKVFSRDVTLEHGKMTTLPVRVETTGQRVVSYVVLGVGLAGVVAGGVFTGLALSEQSKAQGVLDAKSQRNITPQDLSDYGSAIDARDMWKRVATATFAGAAGVLAVGGLLYLFDKPSLSGLPPAEAPAPKGPGGPTAPPKEMEMGFEPVVGPGFVGLRGKF